MCAGCESTLFRRQDRDDELSGAVLSWESAGIGGGGFSQRHDGCDKSAKLASFQQLTDLLKLHHVWNHDEERGLRLLILYFFAGRGDRDESACGCEESPRALQDLAA